MASIFAKLLGSLFNKQRTTGRVVRVELAPVGYDPFKDPDGEQLRAAMGGRRFAPSLGNAGPWLSIAPWALAFLAVVAVAVWWYVLRPANVKAKMIAAAATAVAAMPTPTPTFLVTETVRAERDRATEPAPTVTSTPTITATPTPQKPTMTFTPPPTPTWTPPPTETPTMTPTPTPTPTPTWATSPVQPVMTSAPGSAQLAASSVQAGDSMVVTGYVNNGSIVRLLWEDGKTVLGQGSPGLSGSYAIPFVVPGNVTNGYHVVYVVWSAGKSDHVIPLVLSINVPPPATPTWTPIPLPTFTPTWTPTPTVTPTPYPTPVGGWPCHVYLPVVSR